jgi:hypothetical protein
MVPTLPTFFADPIAVKQAINYFKSFLRSGFDDVALAVLIISILLILITYAFKKSLKTFK